ncbi:MAG: hypothetical protein HYY65_14495 [Candidatus Tectomicrobia bacterium]|uniref:Glycine cleavage system protein H n=1 Tax=Tectimicrobiota bacterium TaxID=2528274 RepID=A0A932GSK2_UNCTE|nr:hypothetical protein [Candidatus Tectomicrobia bacterium]
MVAIFVVLLILFFLLMDSLVLRLKEGGLERAALWIAGGKEQPLPVPLAGGSAEGFEGFYLPPGLFLSSQHAWLNLLPSGKLKVGVDDFSRRILGRIDQVETPPVGTEVAAGEELFRIHQGTKSVAYASPAAGTVAAVNPFVLRDPRTVKRDPYGAGWILALKPADPSVPVRASRVGEEARSWLRSELTRFRDFLMAQTTPDEILGRTLADGGFLVDRSLENMGPGAWRRFEEEFLSARRGEGPGAEAGRASQ